MNENELLIIELMKKFDVSAEQLIGVLIQYNLLDYSKLEQLCGLQSIPIPQVEVGWFAFAGNKFSHRPDAYENCLGVVALLYEDTFSYVGKRGLILIPEQYKGPWSSIYTETFVRSTNNGFLNTMQLLKHAKSLNVPMPGIEWAASYSKNGVKAGQAFVPAIEQLNQIKSNQSKIDEAFQKINVSFNWNCWSSTETARFRVCVSQEHENHVLKTHNLYTPCVVPF